MKKLFILFILFISLVVAAGALVFFKPGLPNAQAMQLAPLSHKESQLLSNGNILIKEIKPNPGNKIKGKSFEARVLIHSNLDHVYQTLTQFEHYDQFMPQVKKTRVLWRKRKEAVVNYTLKVPFGGERKYRLRMTSSKNKEDATIEWKMIPWPELSPKETIGDTEGYWMLKKSGDDILLLYRVYVDPGQIPKGLEWLVNKYYKKNIPALLDALRRQTTDRPKKTKKSNHFDDNHLSIKPLCQTSLESKTSQQKSESVI
ncbi:MAG: hypothetical protein HZC17_00340 [Candidatus Omnitrophica bacterium]|nr:hypothetical protein [Candidatus Omnitrophota bacterium]